MTAAGSRRKSWDFWGGCSLLTVTTIGQQDRSGWRPVTETFRLRPWADAPRSLWAGIRVVATDIDGTITTGGRIAATTVAELGALAAAGLAVVLVTGRSAGWGAALGAYVPGLTGVLAENGAVWLGTDPEAAPIFIDPLSASERPTIADADAAVTAVISELGSGTERATDNYCRLTDRTLRAGVTVDPFVVAAVAHRFGLAHTWSSVHHHLSTSAMTKRTGLLAALAGPGAPPGRVVDPRLDVLTVGDSGNDAGLFDTETFAATVGVAGVRRHIDALGAHLPAWVTMGDGGDGFAEVVRTLLGARRTGDGIR
jgi:hydroxymethylpyrimidine pyrophosphatase-like HAD family hydrolase